MDTSGTDEIDYSQAGMGYTDQAELLRDWFAMLDYRIYLLYRYHVWLGPQNRMQGMLGLVISREEFEQKLDACARINGFAGASEDELTELAMRDRLVGGRLAHTDAKDIPCLRLVECCELDAFAWRCVLLAFSARLDAKYNTLFAYLQDDVARKAPTFELACRLFAHRDSPSAENYIRFAQRSRFSALFEQGAWERGELRLLAVVEAFLLEKSPPLPIGFRLELPQKTPPPIREKLAAQLRKKAADKTIVVLRGAPGMGKRFLAQSAIHAQNRSCLLVDLARSPEQAEECARTAALLGVLLDATPCFYHLEALSASEQTAVEDALAEIPREYPQLFLCTQDDYRADSLADRFALSFFEVPALSDAQSAALFEQLIPTELLAGDVSLQELSTKFHFTPLQVVKAARQAMSGIDTQTVAITAELLHACCYAQAVHQLDALATSIPPAYGWDDLILPPRQLRMMQQACAQVQYSYQVNVEWGFQRRVQYGRGLSLLFSGPSGTGKTMAAQVIAKQLHMELYKIQLSQVVSKYIGETEKNLRTVFQEAKKSSSILFFDECDALFGKRSEVKDSHDRHANVETAYLLQQMEEYEGVTILATNLLQNIDAAFMRRIGFVISFPLPDKAMRERLFRGMLPVEAPVSPTIDFAFLANQFDLSGGSIKNVVVSAAFRAAEQGCAIGMPQLLSAAVSELQKNDIVVSRTDLREYQDLVEW